MENKALELIVRITAENYDVSVEEMLSKTNTPILVNARTTAMFLCRELTGESYQTIGDFFGGRDHSTIFSAHSKSLEKYKSDEDYKAMTDSLVEKIKDSGCNLRKDGVMFVSVFEA